MTIAFSSIRNIRTTRCNTCKISRSSPIYIPNIKMVRCAVFECTE